MRYTRSGTKRHLIWLVGGVAMLTAGCADTRGPGGTAGGPRSGGSEARAPGDGVGHYKVGRPYQINGKWYTPYVDYDYNATGVASWYGPGFHGRPTANGEIFDQNEITAAHTTLPLPSVARVTNLENGRSLILRVNDRGPFVDGRILDVSRRSAQLLGFEQSGLAQVRIELLADESKQEMMIAQGNLPRRKGEPATAIAAAPPPTQPAQVAAAATPAESEAAPARVVAVTATALDAPAASPPKPESAPPAVGAAAPVAPPTVASSPVVSPPAAAAPTQLAAVASPPPAASRPTSLTPSRASAAAPAPAPRFALVSPAAAAPSPQTLRPSIPAPEPARAAAAPATAPAAAPPSSAGGMVVHAGSFRTPAGAERLRARLASSGYASAQVVGTRSGGETIYRVKVGPLATPAQAERVMEAAIQIAQEEARVAAR